MKECDIYELMTEQVSLLLADIDHLHTEEILYSDPFALLTYL